MMSVFSQIPDVYFRYYPTYSVGRKVKYFIPPFLNVYPNQPSRKEREITSLKI
jgi:hypothetical protein